MKKLPKIKKLVRVKDQDIDVRRVNLSLMKSTYDAGVENARQQAKREKRRLITKDGIEDYREKNNG